MLTPNHDYAARPHARPSCSEAASGPGRAVGGMKRRFTPVRIGVAVLAALVFCAGVLFDTQALFQLGWICMRGGCGIGLGWTASLALLGSAGLLLAFRRPAPATPRRRSKPRSSSAGKRAPVKPAKTAVKGAGKPVRSAIKPAAGPAPRTRPRRSGPSRRRESR